MYIYKSCQLFADHDERQQEEQRRGTVTTASDSLVSYVVVCRFAGNQSKTEYFLFY